MKGIRDIKRTIVSAIGTGILVATLLASTPGTSHAGVDIGAGASPELPQTQVGSGFTYQGRLLNGGSPANGQYDLQFTLYDAATGGNRVGTTVSLTNQAVTNGLFTAGLDFGSSAFAGSARWLEIATRQTGGGTYTTLTPRQALTATPYALGLMPGAVITTTSTSPAFSVTNNGGNALESYVGNGATALSGVANGSGNGVVATSISGSGLFATSISGKAVWGTSGSGPGVVGNSTDSQGVQGTSDSAAGGYFSSNSGNGLEGHGPNAIGVAGYSTWNFGVYGESTNGAGGYFTSTNASGVRGVGLTNTGVGGQSDSGRGVFGSSNSGVGGNFTSISADGLAASTISGTNGLTGSSASLNGNGVEGVANNGTSAYGVFGVSGSGDGVVGTGPLNGVYGHSPQYGVYGYSSGSYGVYGYSNDDSGVAGSGQTNGVLGYGQMYGVYGIAPIDGVYGSTLGTSNVSSIYGAAPPAECAVCWAGYFNGNVNVNGTLYASAKSFKIDDPLDPANKYLNHTSVESPDMLDIYRGHVTLDAAGTAWVQMPDYFQAVNMDFDYQLTAVGTAQPNLYVSQEIKDNKFQIGGGVAGAKVSWQVTGVRHDPYAQANRTPVEQVKPPAEKGLYLDPGLYNQPSSKAISTLYDRGKPAQLPQPGQQSQPGK